MKNRRPAGLVCGDPFLVIAQERRISSPQATGVRRMGPWVGEADMPIRPRGVTVSVVVAGLIALLAPIGLGQARDLSRPIVLPDQAGPASVAIIPDTRFALVADVGLRRVSVVNLAQRRQTATIRVGSQPTDVVVTPDGDRAFVTNSNSGSVAVIDLRTRRVVKTVAGLGFPESLAITPDGSRVFVADTNDGLISVLNGRSGRRVGRISLAGDSIAEDVAVAPDGERAYIARHAYGDVTVVDVDTLKVSGSIPVADGPASLAFSPDGHRLYVASDTGSALSVVDPRGRTELTRIPVDSVTVKPAVAVSPNGRWIYVAGGSLSDSVTLVDARASEVRTVVDGFSLPVGVTPLPGTRRVLVAEYGEDRLGVLWQPGRLPLRMNALPRTEQPRASRWRTVVRRTDWAADLTKLRVRVSCRAPGARAARPDRLCRVKQPRRGVVKVKPTARADRVKVNVTASPREPAESLYRQRTWTRSWSVAGTTHIKPGFG